MIEELPLLKIILCVFFPHSSGTEDLIIYEDCHWCILSLVDRAKVHLKKDRKKNNQNKNIYFKKMKPRIKKKKNDNLRYWTWIQV